MAGVESPMKSAENIERLTDLLKRCYLAGTRTGWEDSETNNEVMNDVLNELSNLGITLERIHD